MKTKLIISVLSVLVLTSVTAFGAEAKSESKIFWDKNCAKCHGVDGKGKTRMGRQTGALDYTDPAVQKEITDERAVKAIKEGLEVKGKEVMKPMADKITDEQIKALIEYMRTFARK